MPDAHAALINDFDDISDRKVRSALECKELGTVIDLCKRRILRNDQDAQAYHFAALALREMQRGHDALGCHAEAIKLSPSNVDFLFQLGITQRRLRFFHEAIDTFDFALRFAPSSLELILAKGWSQFLASDPKCLQTAKNAVLEHRDAPEPFDLLGAAYRATGEIESAIDAYLKAWKLGAKHSKGLLQMVKSMHEDRLDEVKELIESVEDNKGRTKDPEYHFAIAEYEDRKGRFPEAYRNYLQGNDLASERYSFCLQTEIRGVQEMETLFSPTVAVAPNGSPDRPTPIFLVGMPRSGSTLVESILSDHSQITALGEIGELKNAVQKLGNLSFKEQADALKFVQDSYLSSRSLSGVSTKYAVDKYLGNYFYLGHIAHAFPDAKILHIQRDPRANAWSIFKHCFAEGELSFAYNPQNIIDFFAIYRRMMQFWTSKIGTRIYHLSYDSLVSDPEHETKRLFQHLDLPNETRLRSNKPSKRMISTASATQARRPIYQGSSDAWKNYADLAGDWLNQLTDELFING